MYLQRLELVGFKSFAAKTVLEFLQPKKDSPNITAIVGPNGSGKSNLADSIRWALGEQSTKALRGKKSQDVIFSGSDKKIRLNLAEVNLLFNNQDSAAPIDYQEFTITRRIYRNGEGEYLINKSRVRLQDILILLAKSNFGQKSYSIISQGMVDQILQASPLERKKFFDEATGVKQYQIKRDGAVRKIEKSQNNLHQAEIALTEIGPHMRSLTRQVKKLEKRQEIETKLRGLQRKYYGGLWQGLNKQISAINQKLAGQTEKQKKIEKELSTLQQESENLVYEEVGGGYQNLQKEHQKLLEYKNEYIDKQAALRAKLFFEEEKIKQGKQIGQKIKSVVDQDTIFSNLKKISLLQKEFSHNLDKVSNLDGLNKIKRDAQDISKKINEILKYFKQDTIPSPTDRQGQGENIIKKLQEERNSLTQKIEKLDEKLSQLNQKLSQFTEKERLKRTKLFEGQKKIQNKQSELNVITDKINEFKIDLARLETKKDALEDEIKHEMNVSLQDLTRGESTINEESIEIEEIERLKRQLELIGGIDPEIAKEYPQVKERFEFLNTQSQDLKKSVKSLNKIVKELDQKIRNQFKQSFAQINQGFDKYFKILFGGGKAKLILEETEEEENPSADGEENISEKTEIDQIQIKLSAISGIGILATPPGKKIKSVETLSGGERALTSIALICAIIKINKPPFVVLDEVDAALDEENSVRFTQILHELTENTQFIIITHNRQTMEVANLLYGVTMGSDSISRLVSLKLEK